MPGLSGTVPKVSFSAALTSQQLETGTIAFNRVLVNDGDSYDPVSGQWEGKRTPHLGPNMELIASSGALGRYPEHLQLWVGTAHNGEREVPFSVQPHRSVLLPWSL